MNLTAQFIRSVALNEAGAEARVTQYPFSIPAVRRIGEEALELHPKGTYLIGENGSGKSTLVEGIAVAAGFSAEGGSPFFGFSTRESHSDLHNFLRLVRGYKRPKDGFFLRAESFYNVASYVEDHGRADYYGGKSLHEQSHGESFLALMMSRFVDNGLYILDEPEAALSPSRQMSILPLIHRHVGTGSQFIIATHSPIVMAYPDAIIYRLSERGIERVAYEETEHVIVTRQFLSKREEMLGILLEGQG